MLLRSGYHCELKSPCAGDGSGCKDREKGCFNKCPALKHFQGVLDQTPCYLQAVDSSGTGYQFAPLSNTPRRTGGAS